MKQAKQEQRFYTPPAAVFQWQWEDSVDVLRRRACEEAISRHWTTTGITALDATARAHIAEWLAIDVAPTQPDGSESIVDALIHRALLDEPWDLYVIEGSDSSAVFVRRLRDQRGYRIQWLEGRTVPRAHSTVALRVIDLDPPGLCASTLPIVFGDDPGSNRLLRALLCSYGAHKIETWRQFMRGPGARIVLEYGLSNLLLCGQEAVNVNDFRAAAVEGFKRLEAALQTCSASVPHEITFDDGQIAWIEDITSGPHLKIFSNREDSRKYRRATAALGQKTTSGGAVPWCRVYRDKQIRIHRQDRDGSLIDPRPSDYHAIQAACHRMTSIHIEHAA